MNLTKKKTLPLALGALGVVFGDIGTSPLYSVNEIYEKTKALEETKLAILGGISLIVWSLTIIVTIKYIVFVLRADDSGEGGVFALYSLLRRNKNKATIGVMALLVVAAGMLFGDGVITPAISVLASVEGLEVVSTSFQRFVLPITILILALLFAFQSKGTHKVGKLFGPVTLLWFSSISVIGIYSIVQTPEILRCIDPLNIIHAFDAISLKHLLLLLGSVMLVVTGGEALYADLGHFGKRPIRLSWLSIVYPALILNYLGQGAYLLSGDKIRAGNLFFSTVPSPFIIPMVILATLATVIASQALITGAFSLASQGMAMNLIPKMRIVHTNYEHEGHIYIPFVNWSLFIGCIFLVLTFRSSSALASAYGLAVSAVMLVTTISMLLVSTRIWQWNKALSFTLFGLLGLIDATFLFANMFKLLEGGYVPVAIGLTLATIMFTWNWGRRQVRFAMENLDDTTMSEFLHIKNEESEHFPRSIIMLTPEHAQSLDDQAPPIVTLFKKRFDHLPRHLVLLTIRQKRHPYIDRTQRYDVVEFDNDHEKNRSLLSIQVNFGYMEEPDVETIIQDLASDKKLSAYDDPNLWLIHAAKERVVVKTKAKGLQKFRYGLFRSLSRQAQPAYNYFGLDNDSRLSLELISLEL